MTTRVKPRFQYRLATLFASMVIVAIAASWYGNRLRAREREEDAFRRIAAKGGWILHYAEGTSVGFGPPPWKNPGGFLCGTGLRGAYEPTSDKISFSDGDISLLDDIINIGSVSFKGTLVSPAARNRFEKFHKVRIVD